MHGGGRLPTGRRLTDGYEAADHRQRAERKPHVDADLRRNDHRVARGPMAGGRDDRVEDQGEGQ